MDAPAVVEIGGDVLVVLAAVVAGDEMLVAVFDPAHRAPQLHGQGREQDLFGIKIAFRAEAAAHVRHDDAQVAFTQAGDLLRDEAAHQVRALRR